MNKMYIKFIFFFIVSLCCISCTHLNDVVQEYINLNMVKGQSYYSIDLREVLQIDYDSMYIFGEYSNTYIEDIIGIEYCNKNKLIADSDHRIILFKNGKIVYEDDFWNGKLYFMPITERKAQFPCIINYSSTYDVLYQDGLYTLFLKKGIFPRYEVFYRSLEPMLSYRLLDDCYNNRIIDNCLQNKSYKQCDRYSKYDSLRYELFVNYNYDVLSDLKKIDTKYYHDSFEFKYYTLLCDSTELYKHPNIFWFYENIACNSFDNDTITSYYLSKGYGKYDFFSEPFIYSYVKFRNDSIKRLLQTELSRDYVSPLNVIRGNVKISEVVFLVNYVYNTCNDTAYYRLRELLNANNLFPIAVYVANNSNNPIACVDALKCYMFIHQLDACNCNSNIIDYYNFTLNEMVELIIKASDLHYAPASFILANMYFSGDLVPQDTIKGKKLLDEYGIVPIVPFWRYKPNPPIYQQLLEERDSIIQNKNKL